MLPPFTKRKPFIMSMAAKSSVPAAKAIRQVVAVCLYSEFFFVVVSMISPRWLGFLKHNGLYIKISSYDKRCIKNVPLQHMSLFDIMRMFRCGRSVQIALIPDTKDGENLKERGQRNVDQNK